MAAPGARPVVIVTGPPGVGKTTAARTLAERSDRAACVEADAFFGFIRPGRIEPWKPEAHEQNQLVMGLVADVTASYAAAGYFTILDGIVLPQWFLAPVFETLRAAGHAVAYAVLRASLPTCLSRARDRESRPFADAAVVTRIWHDFSDLGVLEGHAIDVDGLTPGETADLLAARLEDGTLVIPA